MQKNRYIEIAIELDQVITVTRRPPSRVDWCPECESGVVMVTFEEAASVVNIRALALITMIEARQIHLAENKAGLIRLCLPSLLQAMITAL